MANTIVKGDLQDSLKRKLKELKRQIQQPKGYPFNPYHLEEALQQATEGKFARAGFRVWTVWMSIKPNTKVKTVDHFRRQQMLYDYKVSSEANKMLSKINICKDPNDEVDLINVSLSELGLLGNNTPTPEVYNKALGFGLGLCRSWVAPQLFLKYQPEDIIHIATENLSHSIDKCSVFNIYGNKLDGRTDIGYWYADARFIFTLPRK